MKKALYRRCKEEVRKMSKTNARKGDPHEVKLVVKHDRDGIRYVQPYLGVNRVTGRPLRPYRRFPAASTDEEALALAVEWLATVEGAARLGTSPKVADVLESYVRSLEAAGASPNTCRTYRGYARLYVSPALGRERADSVEPMDLARLRDELLARGSRDGSPLSPQTVAGCHWFLRGAWGWMCSVGVASSNPAAAIDSPRVGAAPATAYDEGDFARLEAALRSVLDGGDPVGAAGVRRRNVAMAAWVSLHTGLRVGEVCALRRRDVQRRGIVSVSSTCVEVSGAGVVRRQRPKTASSRRNVSVTGDDLATIRAHAAWQDRYLAPTGRDTPLVTVDGSHMRPTTVSREFASMRDALGIDPCTSFHSLRHTHATWLLIAGVDPKTVSERLGHGSVATTLRLYAHVLPGRDSQAAEGFAAVARGMGDRDGGL